MASLASVEVVLVGRAGSALRSYVFVSCRLPYLVWTWGSASAPCDSAYRGAVPCVLEEGGRSPLMAGSSFRNPPGGVVALMPLTVVVKVFPGPAALVGARL